MKQYLRAPIIFNRYFFFHKYRRKYQNRGDSIITNKASVLRWSIAKRRCASEDVLYGFGARTGVVLINGIEAT